MHNSQLLWPCGEKGVLTHLHEGGETLVLLLPGFDELQGEGLVTAESAHCLLDLLLLSSTELENSKPEDLLVGGWESYHPEKTYYNSHRIQAKHKALPKTATHLLCGRWPTTRSSCVSLSFDPLSSLKFKRSDAMIRHFCGDLSEENVFWKKTYHATEWFPPGWWICSWCQQRAVCFLGWVSGRRHCLGPSTCGHGLAPCRTVLRASEGYF